MHCFLDGFFGRGQIAAAGAVFAFALTFLGLKFLPRFLPADHGREYAVNGALSKGKKRGVGLVFVTVFVACSLIFMPFSAEYFIYCVLIMAIMLSGYFDDAAKTPWNEYKKGLIDLVLSVLTVAAFLYFNGSEIIIGGYALELPVPVYFILGVILLWASINVTNCSDGVDGLCATVCCVSISSFAFIFADELGNYVIACAIFAAVLLAYLCFNSSPSSMLMGDAGSRALGFFIALAAMKTGRPFMYLLLAITLIVDGGAGIIKVSLKRFLNISILSGVRTPIHDHMRKNKGWSDTQVVFRFAAIQILFAAAAYVLKTLS